jgi:pyridoxal phosphate enzyme (YggS family)
MTREGSASSDRRGEIGAALHEVRQRITAACVAAGRDPAEITLIAVTKTRPVDDIVLLAELGVTDIGENRDQEARPKAEQCAALGLRLTWHFVGQLQARKAASVVSYADVVHSVDRIRLVGALAARARRASRIITCLIQVSLEDPGPAAAGGQGARGGADPPEVAALAGEIAAARPSGEGSGGLVLGGVMAVAPLGQPPAPAFAKLAGVAADMRARHPEATVISAGMSGDLEEAVAAGATHLRIGTALLGGRPPLVG